MCRVQQGFVQPGLADAGHGVLKGAHARQDDMAGCRDDLRRIGDDRFVAQIFQRLLDAAQIAHAVVDDGDHGWPPF